MAIRSRLRKTAPPDEGAASHHTGGSSMIWKLGLAVVLAVIAAVIPALSSYWPWVLVLGVVVAFIIEGVRIVPQQSAWVVERLGRFPRHARAGPQSDHPLPRPCRLHAVAEGSAARCARADLHHDGQYRARGRRYPVLPGDRSAPRLIRLIQLHRGDLAAGADHAAQRDRQDGARQDIRVARRDQPADRRLAGRGGPQLGNQGAALRDQEPDAAGSDPALDAAADHRRAGKTGPHS